MKKLVFVTLLAMALVGCGKEPAANNELSPVGTETIIQETILEENVIKEIEVKEIQVNEITWDNSSNIQTWD